MNARAPLWNLNFWVQWRTGSKSIEFICTWKRWEAVWISLQKIDRMTWAVTAKSHPWRKPVWCKCIMESHTITNLFQSLRTIRTNSSCRHCLAFQRWHWGDLLMSWAHCPKPPQWLKRLWDCETASWVLVWKKQCASILEDVIDIYLGLLLVVYYFNSQMYPMFLPCFLQPFLQSTNS